MSPSLTEVRLHPAQSYFLQSSALYKAFVGGVGSGKSWAGSYDLIKKSKAGRLYAVIAPTFTMLSDATMRGFVQVATSLGAVKPSDIKRGNPPTVKLKTGAEVIFRSGDDPDHLYGPNLSGVWLDEASLMPREVFTVAIGRLREAGQQGFLTATFTPKGLQHWTYDAFATNKPNTAIFFAKTSDNPFLPDGFATNVASQYTSRMRLQELEGQFIDSEGGLFRREWFKVTDVQPRIVRRVRSWDLAATAVNEKKASDPDWTVGALLGKAENGDIWILDIRRLRGSPQQVQQTIRTAADDDGKEVAVWFEQEPGSAGVALVDHLVRTVLPGFNVHAERSTGSKALRAEPLAAAAERGLVKIAKAHWDADLLDELAVFPHGSHDDQVDASALGFSKLARPSQQLWISTCDVPSAGPRVVTLEELKKLPVPPPPETRFDAFGYERKG